MENSKIIEVRNLTHIFKDGSVGIKNIDLNIYNGDFIVLTGANGSGKTVLSRHLNGLIKPSTGSVLFRGGDVRKNPINARKNIGLIFQDSNSQFINLTVKEDIAFGPKNLGKNPDEIDVIVKNALKSVDLTSYANKNPYALSGGQKRKLAVAGVLALGPQLIIFDEPFTGLDYSGVNQILELLLKLKKEKFTVLVITHELEKVLAYASRLIVMHQGEVVKDCKPVGNLDFLEEYNVRNPLKNGTRLEDLTWLA